jgi:hypothetical protein
MMNVDQFLTDKGYDLESVGLSELKELFEAYASSRLAEVTAQRDAALLREETAQHSWKQSLDLLDKIAETLRRLPSVTGLSQVEKHEDIPLAIGDLQACYIDASRARNGLYTKVQAENATLRAELERAKGLLEESWTTLCDVCEFHGDPEYHLDVEATRELMKRIDAAKGTK